MPSEVSSPDWVKEGSGLVQVDGKRYFQGVGTQRFPPQASTLSEAALRLRTATAQANARAEVAKVLNHYVGSTSWGWHTDGDEDSEHARRIQLMHRVVRAGMPVALSQNEVTLTWNSPDSAHFAALARLDYDAYLSAVLEQPGVDERMRAVLRTVLDHGFEDMEKEEGRRASR